MPLSLGVETIIVLTFNEKEAYDLLKELGVPFRN